jgi:hypothetical protein
MGVQKKRMLEREDLRGMAEQLAIDAGIAWVCELHEDEVLAGFASEEELQEAYELAEEQIKSGQIKLPSTISKQEFKEMIKEVVEDSLPDCPQCSHIANRDE